MKTGPHTRKCVSSLSDELGTLRSLRCDHGIEVLNSFPEPHAEDKKGGHACSMVNILTHGDSKLLHTNHEAKEPNQSGSALDCGLVEDNAHLPGHLFSEVDESEAE